MESSVFFENILRTFIFVIQNNKIKLTKCYKMLYITQEIQHFHKEKFPSFHEKLKIAYLTRRVNFWDFLFQKNLNWGVKMPRHQAILPREVEKFENQQKPKYSLFHSKIECRKKFIMQILQRK